MCSKRSDTKTEATSPDAALDSSNKTDAHAGHSVVSRARKPERVVIGPKAKKKMGAESLPMPPNQTQPPAQSAASSVGEGIEDVSSQNQIEIVVAGEQAVSNKNRRHSRLVKRTESADQRAKTQIVSLMKADRSTEGRIETLKKELIASRDRKRYFHSVLFELFKTNSKIRNQRICMLSLVSVTLLCGVL